MPFKNTIVFFLINATTILAFSGNHIDKSELMKRWPKAEAIINKYKTTIEFYINPETNYPAVKQVDEIEIVPLYCSKVERMYFYNNQSQINSASMNKDGLWLSKMYITSGDWESDGIFHSDQKFSHYVVETNLNADYYLFNAEQTIKDVRYFSKLFFHDAQYPVKEYTLDIIIPRWLELNVKEFNFDFFNVKLKDSLITSGRLLRYQAFDLNKFENKKNLLSLEHSYPHLLFLFKSYVAGGKRTSILKDIADLYAWYQHLKGDLDNCKSELEPVVSKILQGSLCRTDSIKAIYYWVQDHIRYIAFEEGLAGFRPEVAEKVYQNKYGDCKGMANLLRSMLNLAGFDARIAWLGTNHLIYDYSTPCMAVNNHMICYLNDDGHEYYLDATQKMMPLDQNGESIKGKQVLIEDGENYLIKTIPETPASQNLIKTEAQLVLANNKLDGDVSINYKGNSNNHIISSLSMVKVTDQVDFFKKYLLKNSQYICDSLRYSDISNREDNFEVSFKTTINGHSNLYGNEFYVNLDFTLSSDNFIIDTLDVYHIYFGKKIDSELTTTFNIPINMEIKSLPPNVIFQEGPFAYEISYAIINNQIKYNRRIIIEESIIPKKHFMTYSKFNQSFFKNKNQFIELRTIAM